jgi:sugar/nucleoside kinase (ribokinase family)
VSGYLLLQSAGHEAALAALDRARSRIVAVEAASWPIVEAFGAERFFRETDGVATAVLANEREAEVLTGRSGADAASALGERYALAVVKRDRRGAVVCADGELFVAEAEPVTEVDPTGAGDAFDGALLARLVGGDPPAAALARACHAGAIVASRRGTWPPREGAGDVPD